MAANNILKQFISLCCWLKILLLVHLIEFVQVSHPMALYTALNNLDNEIGDYGDIENGLQKSTQLSAFGTDDIFASESDMKADVSRGMNNRELLLPQEILAQSPRPVQDLHRLLVRYLKGDSNVMNELYDAACAIAVGELELLAQQFKQYMGRHCVGWNVNSSRHGMPAHCSESIDNARQAHDKYYLFLKRHCVSELDALHTKYSGSNSSGGGRLSTQH